MTYSGGIPSGSKVDGDPLWTGSFSTDPGKNTFPGNVFPGGSGSDFSLYSPDGPTITRNIFARYNYTLTSIDQTPFGFAGGTINSVRTRGTAAVAGGGGAAGVPLTVGDCQLWLDATDITNGGSQPVDGTAVSIWSDKSGNNNHFTQSYSIYKPFVSSSHGAANNKDVVFFSMPSSFPHMNEHGGITTSGSSDRMGSELSSSYPITLFTVFASAEDPSVIYAQKRLFVQGSRMPDAYWTVGNSLGTVNSYAGRYSPHGGPAHLSAKQDTFYVTALTITAQEQGASSFYINGNLSGSYPGGYSDSAWGPGNLALGPLYPDYNDYNSWGTSGSIAEVILYNTVLNETDRTTITEYLFDKWGVVSGAA
jgi:hypothetical protein